MSLRNSSKRSPEATTPSTAVWIFFNCAKFTKGYLNDPDLTVVSFQESQVIQFFGASCITRLRFQAIIPKHGSVV